MNWSRTSKYADGLAGVNERYENRVRNLLFVCVFYISESCKNYTPIGTPECVIINVYTRAYLFCSSLNHTKKADFYQETGAHPYTYRNIICQSYRSEMCHVMFQSRAFLGWVCCCAYRAACAVLIAEPTCEHTWRTLTCMRFSTKELSRSPGLTECEASTTTPLSWCAASLCIICRRLRSARTSTSTQRRRRRRRDRKRSGYNRFPVDVIHTLTCVITMWRWPIR